MFVFVWSLQVVLSYKTGAVPIGTTAFLFYGFMIIIRNSIDYC